MKIAPFLLVLVLTMIILTAQVSATYLNGKIKIDDRGVAYFEVETDIPILADGLSFENNKLTGKTNSLTAKINSVWTFSLHGQNYENIFLDIKLPGSTSSITSLSGNQFLLDTKENTLTLLDSGELNFQVSYTLAETFNYTPLIFVAIIAILAVVFYIVYKIKKKKDRLNHIMPIISENEQKIISLLMKSPARQKEVRKILNFAKASFSRYISNLEKKKLITREGDGKNKILKLK